MTAGGFNPNAWAIVTAYDPASGLTEAQRLHTIATVLLDDDVDACHLIADLAGLVNLFMEHAARFSGTPKADVLRKIGAAAALGGRGGGS